MTRKILHIVFSFLWIILTSGMTVSRHYCGGEITASRVSVWGNVASCGMEETTDTCTQPGRHFEEHCCNNTISVYEVDPNYSPAFSGFKTITQPVLQVFTIPENSVLQSIDTLPPIEAHTGPPGPRLVNAVSLPKICIFRI